MAAAHSSLEQISNSLQNPSTKVKGMVDSLLGVLDGMKSGKPVSAGGKPLTAKNFVTSMQMLGFKRGEGAKSAYYTVDGDTTTRTSDHSANAELFVQDGTANNLSIVIRRPHDRKRFNKDNSINVIEAVFPRTDLESNPEKLAQIIRDIGEFIATGEYHDTAGAMAYNFSGDDAYQAKARDILYLDAVNRKDMETAERMVREAAASQGWHEKSTKETLTTLGITVNTFDEFQPFARIWISDEQYAVSGETIEDRKFDSLKDAVKYLADNGFDGRISKGRFDQEFSSLPDSLKGLNFYHRPSYTVYHHTTKQIYDYIQSRRTADTAVGEPVYIRFGKLPKGGRSRNYAEGVYEPGVSVFTGLRLKDGSVVVIPETPQQLGTLLHVRAQGRPVFVATGDVNGRGSDGEPTLDNTKIISAKEYTFTPPTFFVKNGAVKRADVTYDDAGNVIPLSQRFNPESNDIRYLHDGERIVGSYNRATGEVKLAKGASVETVLHELGWHAARHWAEVNADSDTKAANLLNQMKKYAESAPKEIKDAVRDVYGDLDADTLLDEIGAHRFVKDQSGKIAEALATKEGAAWYQKVRNKVVDFFKNFLTKIGYNRVDLDGVENMSPEVFGDFLADVMMSGKQLGERTAFSMEAPKGLVAKWTNNLSDYKAPIAELEKRVTGSSNNIYYLARTLEGQAQRGKNRAERAIKRVEKILGDKVSPELLAQYMQLKAYEERNAKIERRNGKADASGVTPEDAKAIEKTIKDSGVDEAIFEEAAQILWDLQKEGLQARVDAGLLDQETANKWMTDEPHHIPWKDAVDPDSGEYVGRRMGASEFDTAEGRKTAASGDPITWMLQEYQDAMTRAAQNRLRSSIANLTRLNGDVGTIYDGIQTDSKGKRSFVKYPKKGSGGAAKVLSIPEGVKIESTVKNDGGMKNVLTFKEGGETKYLVLNGTLGEAVAGAVTGRTLARPPAWISWTMRGYSATATALSPAFAVRNIAADNYDIHNNLVSKYGWVKGEKMFAQVVKAQMKMTAQLAYYVENGSFKTAKDGGISDFQKLVEAYEDAGGLIGGMTTEGYEATVRKIEADFRYGKNKVRTISKAVATQWTLLQRMSELAPRLAVFKAAMASGMSAKEAAMLSRESTVDFNKKGQYTPWLNTLIMFSNSALGSNTTQMKNLLTKGGLKLAGGLAMYGFAEGLLEAMMNSDDDEREKEGLAASEDITEYTRQNSLYIRNGDKIYRIPVHMGPFSYAKYFGNVMARMFCGKMSPERAAKELGLTAAEIGLSFTGLGNVSGDALVQTATPSILQPFVQMATNKDYAGRPVYKTKFDESKPDSSHGRKSTPEVYKAVSSWLNSITGGDAYSKGWVDIAPETIKMVTESLGKNFVRDVVKIAETGNKIFSGEIDKLDVRNVPVVGDFVRKQDGNDNRFYEAYNRYRDDKYKLKDPELKGDARREYLKAHPWLKSAGKPGVSRIDRFARRIEKLRDIEDSKTASEKRKAEAKADRRKLQARVIELMGE